MDKKRRILLFILLVVLIFGGNILLQMWLAPEKPAPVDKVVALLKDPDQSCPLAVLGNIPVAGPVFRLPPPPKEVAPKYEEFKKLVAERQAKEAEAQKAQAAKAAEAAQKDLPKDVDIVLDDPDSKMRVVISKNRATVRQITLKEFQAADRRVASPAYLDEAKQTPKLLSLLDDEGDRAKQSYALYIGGKEVQWELEKQSPTEAVFKGEAGPVTVRKRFRLRPGEYHLGLELEFTNNSDVPQEVVYSLVGPGGGPPIEGEFWQRGTIRQVVMGAKEVEGGHSFQFLHGIRAVKGKGKLAIEGPEVRQLSLSKPVLEDRGAVAPLELQYAGVMVPFFAAVIVADGDPLGLKYIEEVRVSYDGDRKPMEKDLIGRLVLESRPIKLEPAKSQQHNYLLYSGPSKVRLLKYEEGVSGELVARYEEELQLRLMTDAPDRSWWGGRFSAFIGWTALIVWFTNLMHGILEWFHAGGIPYWLCIIFLTVLVRGAMFPISRRQALMSRDMQEKMAKLRPELQKIQEKYKDDYRAKAQAQMELQRKYGVSPFGGCMGCLVVLLQMPVFLGLYWALNESIHLRLAEFLWIDNLAAPDMLLHWEKWPVIGWIASIRNPFTGLEILGPYFNILPIVAIVFMLIQQKLIMPPTMDPQMATQMKMMNYMMILMAWLFYWVASGLCLYFSVSSAWALIERKLLPKKKPAGETQPALPAPGKRKAPERASRDGKPKGFFGQLGHWWSELQKKAEKKP